MKTLNLKSKNMRESSDSSRAGDFQYRRSGEMIRVWRTNWFDDQFEQLTEEEFEQFKKWAKRFSMTVYEAED